MAEHPFNGCLISSVIRALTCTYARQFVIEIGSHNAHKDITCVSWQIILLMDALVFIVARLFAIECEIGPPRTRDSIHQWPPRVYWILARVPCIGRLVKALLYGANAPWCHFMDTTIYYISTVITFKLKTCFHVCMKGGDTIISSLASYVTMYILGGWHILPELTKRQECLLFNFGTQGSTNW